MATARMERIKQLIATQLNLHNRRPTKITWALMDSNPDRLEASYGKLVPMLVKAVQELSAENAVLKARLDAAGI